METGVEVSAAIFDNREAEIGIGSLDQRRENDTAGGNTEQYQRIKARNGYTPFSSDLIPWLERVENHDVEVSGFLRKFRRIIVIDRRQDHTFAPHRLATFSNLEGQQNFDDFIVLSYASR
jgi:hypothetical protein